VFKWNYSKFETFVATLNSLHYSMWQITVFFFLYFCKGTLDVEGKRDGNMLVINNVR